MSSVGAAAHHSRIEFQEQGVIELEGTLTEIDWRNPHPSFELRVDQGPRRGQVWQVQVFGAVNTLKRAGVEGQIFEARQRVRLAGRPSSRRENYILGMNILLPDDYEAVLGRNFEPRWSANYVGGVRNFWEVDEGARKVAVDEGAIKAASEESRGMFRAWTLVSLEEQYFPFTENAIAARESWDLHDNPITRCEEPWMPLATRQPPAVSDFEMVENDDGTITIDYAFFGATRRVYMDDPPRAETQPFSRMGFAVGRWEDESLVVETSRVAAPAFDGQGTLLTDAMTLTETFTLSEDQTGLHHDLIIDDPMVFSEPARLTRVSVPLGESLEPYLCER